MNPSNSCSSCDSWFPSNPRNFAISSYGSRTHLSALKERDPQTDRRTSLGLVRGESTSRLQFLPVTSHLSPIQQWVGRRSNPRLLVFSQALNHLSYQPLFLDPCSIRVSSVAHLLFAKKKARRRIRRRAYMLKGFALADVTSAERAANYSRRARSNTSLYVLVSLVAVTRSWKAHRPSRLR